MRALLAAAAVFAVVALSAAQCLPEGTVLLEERFDDIALEPTQSSISKFHRDTWLSSCPCKITHDQSESVRRRAERSSKEGGVPRRERDPPAAPFPNKQKFVWLLAAGSA